MVNDAFLGLAIVVIALVAWLVRLLVADPKGVVRGILVSEKETDEVHVQSKPL